MLIALRIGVRFTELVPFEGVVLPLELLSFPEEVGVLLVIVKNFKVNG